MPSQTPSLFASRFRLSTAHFQFSPVCALTSTLTRRAPVTPLSSTLTRPSRKSIKTGDFNSIRCHTYETPSLKSFRIHTYKKGVGVHGGSSASSASFASSGVASHCDAMLDRVAPAVYNASFIYECLRFHRTSTRPSGHPLGCDVYGAEDERTVRDG